MAQIPDFGQVESAKITVIVDNSADLGTKSSDTIERFKKEPLLAEHGLAVLITLNGGAFRILLDGGFTRISLLENARRMGIDLSAIDVIVLSHGHDDHTASITDVLKLIAVRRGPHKWPAEPSVEDVEAWMQSRRVPLVAHSAAFRERWRVKKDGTSMFGPHYDAPSEEWRAAGAEIIASDDPYRLASGCWTTGFVPRESFETAGIPERVLFRDSDGFHPDSAEEDQSIVINVKDKGLVIISGCAHSGIVNTIQRARAISGVDRVWAVMGGFHLMSADDSEIQQTIDMMRERDPVVVAPSHCTGFGAMCAFARQMPEAFVYTVSGTTFKF